MRYITPRPPVLNPLLARSGRRRHDAPLIPPFFRVFINTASIGCRPLTLAGKDPALAPFSEAITRFFKGLFFFAFECFFDTILLLFSDIFQFFAVAILRFSKFSQKKQITCRGSGSRVAG